MVLLQHKKVPKLVGGFREGLIEEKAPDWSVGGAGPYQEVGQGERDAGYISLGVENYRWGIR